MIAVVLLPVLLPVLSGFALLITDEKKLKNLKTIVAVLVSLNALLTWIAILFMPEQTYTLIRFTEKLTFSLRLDGLSKLFSGMVSILWVFTTFYAFEYMKHEGHERRFFSYFLMSFGVVIGISFSANLFTLYLFYEYLSFSTLPLVMLSSDGRARFAGRKYLLYMVSGGALAFVAMLFLMQYGVSLDFVPGGILDPSRVAGHETLLRMAFIIALLGFGVKAAIVPLHGWLPSASIAPTPVTALLHAVAVVKAGVFSIARVTYYNFGTDLLAGSFAQDIMMALAILTILYGSMMALRTPHLKRRLAYSTISNLSYIVFALSLMNTDGLFGAAMHILTHAVIKITLFFCVGAILYKTGAQYVSEIKGYGKRMPVIMACFVVVSLGLIGLPPFGAFHSKWQIATTAVTLGTPLAALGVMALIVSELLTLLYLFIPIIKAYFAPADNAAATTQDDPNRLMTVPIVSLSALSLLIALFADPIDQLIRSIL